VNEVGDRCQQCVEELKAAFTQFQQACQSPNFADLPPLPTMLVDGLD
jgi:hypothetical protein